MTKINISIPQPCHENWEAMTALDKGKFCTSCQKKVFDFTNASDRQIVNAFLQNENLCGRFLNTQLNRDLVKPKEKSSLWLATTTALISLVGINETTAQQPVKTEQVPTNPKRALGKFMVTKSPSNEIDVVGIVTDEQELPMPGANVTVKGIGSVVNTDFDGKFTIRAKVNDTLVVNFIGFITKEVVIEDKFRNQNIFIKINEDKLQVEGLVVTVGGIQRKRTFFGRIFHAIGNLFR